MDNNNTTTTDEILDFLKDNMVTKEEFNQLNAKVEALNTNVSTLPTKSYLDEKMGELKGSVIEKLRKEDAKVEFIISLMRSRKIITDADIEIIKREFEVFPSLN